MSEFYFAFSFLEWFHIFLKENQKVEWLKKHEKMLNIMDNKKVK